MVEVKRELLHVNAGVRDHARLDLRIMGREVPLGQQEILWVELDKLGKLVAGRVAKLKPQLNHEKTEGLAVH